MKNQALFGIILCFLASSFWGGMDSAFSARANPPVITIATAHSILTLGIDDDGRLFELGWAHGRSCDSAVIERFEE